MKLIEKFAEMREYCFYMNQNGLNFSNELHAAAEVLHKRLLYEVDHPPQHFDMKDAPALRPPNPWEEAIIEACVINFLSWEGLTPKQILNKLIHWEVEIALDPRVSERAAALSRGELLGRPYREVASVDHPTGKITFGTYADIEARVAATQPADSAAVTTGETGAGKSTQTYKQVQCPRCNQCGSLCNCGADRTGPTAEAHLPTCPESKCSSPSPQPQPCENCQVLEEALRDETAQAGEDQAAEGDKQ